MIIDLETAKETALHNGGQFHLVWTCEASDHRQRPKGRPMTEGCGKTNSVLRSVKVQVQDGHSLTQVQVVDEMGGIVLTLQGGFRGASTGSRSNEYNLSASGLGIGIGKGWSLKVVCKSDE